MIVLGRKAQERITIGDNIEITIVNIKGNRVSIGISAPREVPVYRTELRERRNGTECDKENGMGRSNGHESD